MRLSRALMATVSVGALALAAAVVFTLDRPAGFLSVSASTPALSSPSKTDEIARPPSDAASLLQPAPIAQAQPANGLDAIGAATARPPLNSRPAEVTTPAVQATTAPVGALAFAPDPAQPDGNPILAPPPQIEVDITNLREAIASWRIGDLAGGDTFAKGTTNSLARAAADFASVKLQPRLDRILDFLAAYPDWPGAASLRRRAEEFFFADKRPTRQILEFFTSQKPEGPLGRIALARALRDDGRLEEARALVRALWRDSDLNANLEQILRK
jgi:soluble lytic murein transglycosylase